MADPRWPQEYEFEADVLPHKLVEELLALPGLGPEPDALGNMQAGARLEELGDGHWRIEYREGAKEKAVADAVQAHDPTPLPVEAPGPNAYSEMAQALASAKSLADVQTALVPWLERLAEHGG